MWEGYILSLFLNLFTGGLGAYLHTSAGGGAAHLSQGGCAPQLRDPCAPQQGGTSLPQHLSQRPPAHLSYPPSTSPRKGSASTHFFIVTKKMAMYLINKKNLKRDHQWCNAHAVLSSLFWWGPSPRSGGGGPSARSGGGVPSARSGVGP